MRKALPLLLLIALSPLACKPATAPSTDLDNRLLALALNKEFGDKPFTVVYPDTNLGPAANTAEDFGRLRDHITGQLKLPGVDVSALLDGFLARNRQFVRLSLPSAPERGYCVDYEGTYTRYFERTGPGWQSFLKEHPEVRGLTHVSLPYYDPASRTVLLYMDTACAPLAGSGHLSAYRYDGTTLTEVGRVTVGVS